VLSLRHARDGFWTNGLVFRNLAAGDSILVGRRWFGIGVVGIAAYFRQIFLSERYYNRGWEGRMTDLFLKHVSVAESGGEYFQVSFADNEESDDSYFLVQRQFESPYPGRVYVESHLRTLSGHFRIRRAELERSLFRLDIVSAARNGPDSISGRRNPIQPAERSSENHASFQRPEDRIVSLLIVTTRM